MQAPAHGATVRQSSAPPDDGTPVRRYKQLQNWSTCQICGRCRPRGSIGWLDAPYRFPGDHKGPVYTGQHCEDVRVIRCPEHWTESALRISIGRTKKHLLLMRAVQEWAKTACKGLPNPYIEPFPMNDWPNPLPPEQWWHPDLEDSSVHPFQRIEGLAREISDRNATGKFSPRAPYESA